jgi:hypothetical protein
MGMSISSSKSVTPVYSAPIAPQPAVTPKANDGDADDSVAAASAQIGNFIKHALETSGSVGTLLNVTVK